MRTKLVVLCQCFCIVDLCLGLFLCSGLDEPLKNEIFAIILRRFRCEVFAGSGNILRGECEFNLCLVEIQTTHRWFEKVRHTFGNNSTLIIYEL